MVYALEKMARSKDFMYVFIIITSCHVYEKCRQIFFLQIKLLKNTSHNVQGKTTETKFSP